VSRTGTFERFASELEALARLRTVPLDLRRSVDSTNDLGRRILEEREGGAKPRDCLAVVAWEQTRGRGRAGRDWISPAGSGLYLTVVAPRIEPSALGLLPIASAVAVADALAPWIARPLEIKWPNDLLVDGAKLAGVLIEAWSQGSTSRALIGVGVNLGPAAPDVPDRRVTTLGAHATRPPSAATLAMSLIEGAIRIVRRPPPSLELVERLTELCSQRPGDRIEVELGGRRHAGAFAGFGRDGCLLLETARGLERLWAGEIID
jgi:BirA family biotin operon repressor/biotin-[acetyl-CoA-carboxylase] ligase